MMFTKILWRLLSVWRYPRYVADLYCRIALPTQLRRRGCDVGAGSLFLGVPIVHRAPRSVIKIGSGAVLCSRSAQTALGVAHPVVLRTLRPEARIDIGDNARMSGVSICAAESVTIGKNACFGANAMISDTDFHALDPRVRRSASDAAEAVSSPVVIGDDVFIGANAIVLKGVTVGDRVVIGAAAVVTRSIAADAIVAGNPARVLRSQVIR